MGITQLKMEKLHNEEFQNLYISPNITVSKSRRMRRAGHETYMEWIKNSYKILTVKPNGKRILVTPGHK
jgi:hypothetical protein